MTKGTAERIARIRFKREKGYLYYIKSDEEGWLCVYRALMMRGGRKKIEKVRKTKTPVNTKTQSETVKNDGEQN